MANNDQMSLKNPSQKFKLLESLIATNNIDDGV